MKTKKAQSLIEYALILALVTLIAITVLSYISKKVGSTFENTDIQAPVQVESELK